MRRNFNTNCNRNEFERGGHTSGAKLWKKIGRAPPLFNSTFNKYN